MSISQNFPEEGPTLNLNFANSKTLDPRITFTRTSSATYTDDNGLIRVAPANSARFDHRFNPTTGEIESLGLLIEEQRSNLLIGSDYSSNNSLSNVTLTLNATTAPDGTNTAVSMDGESSVSNVKYMYKVRSTNTTGSYVTSVFLKYKSERFIVLRMNDNTGVNGVLQRIDILNGTFTNAVETGGTLTNASSTITPYPNGWYKISVSGTFNDALTQVHGAQVLLTTYGTTTSTNGVYMWGAQLEQGAFPTSYIPTSATTATRTADNASMTGTNFSSWYNQSEGSIMIEAIPGPIPSGGFPRLLNLSSVDNFNRIQLFRYASNTPRFSGVIPTESVQFASDIPDIWPQSVKRKIAYSFKTDNFAASFNGGEIVSDSSGIIPNNLALLFIGRNYSSIDFINGTICNVIYYPVRLTNAQIQTLTR